MAVVSAVFILPAIVTRLDLATELYAWFASLALAFRGFTVSTRHPDLSLDS